MSNSTTWKMLVTNNKYVLCFNGASKPQTPSALKWMIFIKLACGHLTCFTIWHVLVKVKKNYLIRAYNMTFVGVFFWFWGFFFCFNLYKLWWFVAPRICIFKNSSHAGTCTYGTIKRALTLFKSKLFYNDQNMKWDGVYEKISWNLIKLRGKIWISISNFKT